MVNPLIIPAARLVRHRIHRHHAVVRHSEAYESYPTNVCRRHSKHADCHRHFFLNAFLRTPTLPEAAPFLSAINACPMQSRTLHTLWIITLAAYITPSPLP